MSAERIDVRDAPAPAPDAGKDKKVKK